MKARTLLVFSLVAGLALVIASVAVAQGSQAGSFSSNGGGLFAVWDRVGEGPAADNIAPVNSVVAFTPTWWSGGPIGAAVNAIAFDPMISSTLYIGTEGGGLYRSTDGGDTWDNTPNDPAHGLNLSYGHGWVFDVTTAPGVVYAITSGYQWFHWSTDGGNTWSHASGGPGWARDLAVHPAITTTLYAAAGEGVYKSTNGGQSWFLSNTGMASNEWITEIAVNPVTPTIIYWTLD